MPREQIKKAAVEAVARRYAVGEFEAAYEKAEREEAVAAAQEAGIGEEEISVEACRRTVER